MIHEVQERGMIGRRVRDAMRSLLTHTLLNGQRVFAQVPGKRQPGGGAVFMDHAPRVLNPSDSQNQSPGGRGAASVSAGQVSSVQIASFFGGDPP